MSTENHHNDAPTAPEIKGWTAKYIGGEPRLSEQVELFRELGFEVRIEPFDPAACEGCTECFKDSPTTMMILYVRKSHKNNVASDDELFVD